MLHKLEWLLLFFLVLLLPSQLALHFWPSWSLVNGIRSDYLSPTLYFTDFLIIGLIILTKPKIKVPLVVIIFSVFNIFLSLSPLVSVYRWIRILEYYCLLSYLISRLKSPHPKILIWSLSLSLLWTSFLAWGQFLIHHSLGGIWYWLGERSFSLSTPGIAKLALNGELFLRPYATLPHPNALAGYLLIAGVMLWLLKGGAKIILLALLTLFITFSRIAIFMEVLATGLWISLQIKRPLAKTLFLLLTISLLGSTIFLPGNPNSLSERQLLNNLALRSISHHPLTGTGFGTFILSTSSTNYLRQPVHNIYLLLASELGLPVTIIIFYLCLRRYMLLRDWGFKIPLLIVLLTGSADHYWLTLHQNILLLVVLLAIINIQSQSYESKSIL